MREYTGKASLDLSVAAHCPLITIHVLANSTVEFAVVGTPSPRRPSRQRISNPAIAARAVSVAASISSSDRPASRISRGWKATMAASVRGPRSGRALEALRTRAPRFDLEHDPLRLADYPRYRCRRHRGGLPRRPPSRPPQDAAHAVPILSWGSQTWDAPFGADRLRPDAIRCGKRRVGGDVGGKQPPGPAVAARRRRPGAERGARGA